MRSTWSSNAAAALHAPFRRHGAAYREDHAGHLSRGQRRIAYNSIASA
jgi:hypothetical protein